MVCHDGMGIVAEATCEVAVVFYHDAASIHINMRVMHLLFIVISIT